MNSSRSSASTAGGVIAAAVSWTPGDGPKRKLDDESPRSATDSGSDHGHAAARASSSSAGSDSGYYHAKQWPQAETSPPPSKSPRTGDVEPNAMPPPVGTPRRDTPDASALPNPGGIFAEGEAGKSGRVAGSSGIPTGRAANEVYSEVPRQAQIDNVIYNHKGRSLRQRTDATQMYHRDRPFFYNGDEFGPHEWIYTLRQQIQSLPIYSGRPTMANSRKLHRRFRKDAYIGEIIANGTELLMAVLGPHARFGFLSRLQRCQTTRLTRDG